MTTPHRPPGQVYTDPPPDEEFFELAYQKVERAYTLGVFGADDLNVSALSLLAHDLACELQGRYEDWLGERRRGEPTITDVQAALEERGRARRERAS